MKIPTIPFLTIPDAPLISSSQDFLPIADITNDVILYKDGGAALVLESTSLNFSLLSEKEQVAVIAAYAALLNSLSFSIQIVIRTQRKDISSYMNYLSAAEAKIKNPKWARLMQGYKKFIVESIKKKNVLGKSFYFVIPFSPLELGVTKSLISTFKKTGPLPFTKSYCIEKAKITLYPKRDHLIRQATRLGIRLRQLTTSELVSLLSAICNPEAPAVKKIQN